MPLKRKSCAALQLACWTLRQSCSTAKGIGTSFGFLCSNRMRALVRVLVLVLVVLVSLRERTLCGCGCVRMCQGGICAPTSPWLQQTSLRHQHYTL
jgi:hypothetical protein